MVDNSDLQYSSFRNYFPYLLLAIGAHTALRIIANGLKIERTKFDVAFFLVFLSALHGLNILKICGLLAVNYQIPKKINDRKLAYTLTWVFGIGILFTNELLQGYPLGWIHPSLAFIDSYSGLMPRWDVHFNFTMLRMVSFNIDYLDAKIRPSSPPLRKSNGNGDKENPGGTVATPPTISEKQRIETSRPLDEYNWLNYVAFTTYAPLYLAGPIITFNDFMSQTRTTLVYSINFKRISLYALRFFFCLLTMEVLLHYTYVVAISQTRAWTGDSPFQISMIALFNLNVIWLKLLLPWRLFRLWAMIDRIDPPENMVRCVNNNYSAISFWRSWHRSFNRWIIRYVYIPLGGSNRSLVNSLIVFMFVAIWHDIQLRLLLWGWLVVLFILPEVVAGLLFPAKKWGSNPFYRHLCAIAGVANVWMMMIANLVGFCVGLDGVSDMLHQMIHTADGIKYVILSSCALFVGVQVMFEFREREKRMGINLKC